MYATYLSGTLEQLTTIVKTSHKSVAIELMQLHDKEGNTPNIKKQVNEFKDDTYFITYSKNTLPELKYKKQINNSFIGCKKNPENNEVLKFIFDDKKKIIPNKFKSIINENTHYQLYILAFLLGEKELVKELLT